MPWGQRPCLFCSLRNSKGVVQKHDSWVTVNFKSSWLLLTIHLNSLNINDSFLKVDEMKFSSELFKSLCYQSCKLNNFKWNEKKKKKISIYEKFNYLAVTWTANGYIDLPCSIRGFFRPAKEKDILVNSEQYRQHNVKKLFYLFFKGSKQMPSPVPRSLSPSHSLFSSLEEIFSSSEPPYFLWVSPYIL